MVKFICIFLGIVFICGLFLFFPNNTIISQDKKTITVQRQSLYQKWFKNGEYELLTYHQDNIYSGRIISAEKGRHFQGLAGKGGHYVTHYDVVIEYDNGRKICERFGSWGYDDLISKPIIVVEQFYPYYRVYIK